MPHTYHHAFADQATRVVAVATVSGLAALAGWISYRHMLLLARRAGQYGIDAHAFPLTVDGLDLIGVLVLLADRRTGRASGWLPWIVLTVGTIASISANIAVAPDNPVARAISGWTAIALLAAAKMLAHLFEPSEPTEPTEPGNQSTASAAPGMTDAATTADSSVEPDTRDHRRGDGVDLRGRRHQHSPAAAARRIPSSPAAQARWRSVWQATKHLRAATADAAASQDVSLRTLQFIRAAGEAGHLDQPQQDAQHTGPDTPGEPPTPADTGAPPASPHGTLTGAST